jgi:hypothetical protein
MEIKKIYSHRLRNEAHFKFMLIVQRLLIDHPEVAAILIMVLMTRFDELLAIESQLVDADKGSPLTDKISEADRRIDRYLVGIFATVNGALHHYDPAVVAAAESIHRRIKTFQGEIEKKSYEEESAAVGILVDDLFSNYDAQLTLLGLSNWVAQLRDAHNEFDELQRLRNRELAERPQQRLVDLRKEIDAVYREIVLQIESYSRINGDATVRQFVLELNLEVDYFNEHNHHHVKKDINKANVNSIPDQVYNGEPVIVLPEVFYEGEKLIFAKDYSLTYSKNNAPGTAAVLIHGKGAYKGIKNMGFNIVAHT